ncbi:SIR2 family protein [Mannheimia haemolytica]|uniref:SIR2 family protein n=1 Tax=Mannheimia haemolytica TaxID=75985 RepID=UPI003AFADFFC
MREPLLDEDELKKWLQTIFTDNLVIIVGSGLSCAEGLPGMGALADRLKERMPECLDDIDKVTWNTISDCLDSEGLEGALLKHQANETIEAAIIKITAEYVLSEEQKAINKCIAENQKLKFSYLLPHISASNPKIARVITTNYDRLIEFATEYENWGIDSMMVGRYWGKHNPDLSRKLQIRDIRVKGKCPKLVYRDHIKIFKPHGSLDWFMAGDVPMTSCIGKVEEPLIITPGVGKYKKGYGQPFDAHREKANEAIDSASSILCIGYGFNDDHLQTHLTGKIKSGVKTLLLTRGLSENARNVVKEAPNCKALIFDGDKAGTRVVSKQEETFIPNVHWWDVEFFVKEILENGK